MQLPIGGKLNEKTYKNEQELLSLIYRERSRRHRLLIDKRVYLLPFFAYVLLSLVQGTSKFFFYKTYIKIHCN